MASVNCSGITNILVGVEKGGRSRPPISAVLLGLLAFALLAALLLFLFLLALPVLILALLAGLVLLFLLTLTVGVLTRLVLLLVPVVLVVGHTILRGYPVH